MPEERRPEYTDDCIDCGRHILPVVAKETGGRCRPCFGQWSQAEMVRVRRELASGFSPKELNKVCKKKNVDDACSDVVSRIEAKVETLGFDSLADGQRAVLCAESFLNRMCREGARGVLMTKAGDLLEHVEASMIRVGLPEYSPVAKFLLQKAEMLPKGGTERSAAASKVPDDALADVDSAFDAVHQGGDHHDPDDDHPHRNVLMKYVCANRNDFTRPVSQT